MKSNLSPGPYYSPQLHGLEIFDSIDTAGSYEYDIFCIWRNLEDNTLYWDTDSGCSCPSPFEDHGNDLKPLSKETFRSFDQALKNHPDISDSDYRSIRERVKKHLGILEHEIS